MNILAIDYGKKRIGLAWTDTAMGVVLPYGTLESAKEIVDLIKSEKIQRLIVGIPIGLDGKENENTERVRAFFDAIKKQISIPVELVDERFTTAEAKRMGGDLPRRQAGATLDEKAAMLLLQTYLSQKK